MVSKTFGAALQYSAPIFVPQGKTLAISISGTFNATVQIQRLIKAEGDSSYAAHDDAGWNAVTSHTAVVEDQVQSGDGCWYRAYCSAYVSGSPAVKLKM
jgi:hypothetical protein